MSGSRINWRGGRPMRVLVAGGAGFIGSHVCRALLTRGHEVLCLDNLITGSHANIDELESHPRFTFLREDVVRAPLLPVDLVLHLASPASPVHYQQFAIETMLANSAGTHRLLALAADRGARFVFASTSEVYGDPLEHPQKESYWGNVNPVGPRACYDESKRFGEALTFEYRRKHNVSASVVRIFNTYGPRMAADDGRVVPALINAALAGEPMPIHGDGEQTRSFCYVSDLVDVLLLVAFDRDAAGQIFNIGNAEEVNMLELASAVLDATGSSSPISFLPPVADDPARRKPDIRRVEARYDWRPRVALAEGLRHTVSYFRALREESRLAEAA
jgi:nucleoside-diphosphate-sugar epimerase